MRLLRIIAAIIVTPLAAWAFIERVSGPSAQALPSALPSIVRQPAPVHSNFYAPTGGAVNPGDDVLRLHERGIKGRNIGIAVIDRFLLTGHREFGDRLRWYDEIDANAGDTAEWHGTATASIAAGKTVGVAPEADLYFVGLGMIWSGEPIGNWFAAAPRAVHTGQAVGLAIRRVLEMNRRLGPDRKIRAISLAVGVGIRWLDERNVAIAQARAQGIFVSEPDLHPRPFGPVLVASPAATDAYTSAGPAPSWAIAYWAGRYVLAVQENPALTPEAFATTIPR
jgi:hypothetical protein